MNICHTVNKQPKNKYKHHYEQGLHGDHAWPYGVEVVKDLCYHFFVQGVSVRGTCRGGGGGGRVLSPRTEEKIGG